MSEIHACRNNFSRGISTSWSDKEHMPHPRKKIFFLFQTTINSISFLAESYYPPPPLWGGDQNNSLRNDCTGGYHFPLLKVLTGR